MALVLTAAAAPCCSQEAAASSATSFFGFTLGEPIAGKPCPHVNFIPKTGYCVEQRSAVSATKARYSGEAKVNFAFGDLPSWVHGSTFYTEIVEGRLQRVFVITPGPSHQMDVYRDLSGRFGKPIYRNSSPMQNGLGARFDVLESQWLSGPVKIDFRGAVQHTDRGAVTIGTPAGEAAMRDRMDKAKSPRRGI